MVAQFQAKRNVTGAESYALCRSFKGTISDAACLLSEVEFSDAELSSVGLSKKNIERIRTMVAMLNDLNDKSQK